jgi:hypothetical protein
MKKYTARVNGVVMTTAFCRYKIVNGYPTRRMELVVRDPVLGDFAIDNSFTLEVKYNLLTDTERSWLPESEYMSLSVEDFIQKLSTEGSASPVI